MENGTTAAVTSAPSLQKIKGMLDGIDNKIQKLYVFSLFFLNIAVVLVYPFAFREVKGIYY